MSGQTIHSTHWFDNRQERTLTKHRTAVTWVQRLIGIDIETYPAFGEAVRLIALIEDLNVTEKIIIHLDAEAAAPKDSQRPPCRAAPLQAVFDETG